MSIDLWNHRPTIVYLNRLWQRYGSINLLGFPHLGDVPRVRIDSIYVPPNFMPGPDASEKCDVAELLTRHPHVAVLGDPGSGKSTLVAWVTYQLAARAMNPTRHKLGQRVPIPMFLRDMSLTGVTTFMDLVGRVPTDVLSAEERAELLPMWLESGQVAFLIDGLDEVGEAARPGILRVIESASGLFPGSVLLLTSRILGFPSGSDGIDVRGFARLAAEMMASVSEAGPVAGANDLVGAAAGLLGSLTGVALAGGGAALAGTAVGLVADAAGALARSYAPSSDTALFHHRLPTWYVRPFDRAQIGQFVTSWYGMRDASEASRRTGDLLAAIDASTGLTTLAGRPALLTLMALVHRVHTQLPSGRALLYGKISEAYLESLDVARRLAFSRHPLAMQERWLGGLALHMMRGRLAGGAEHEGLALSGDAVRAALIAAGCPEESVPGFLSAVAERSGIFIPRGPDTWAFLHLSFQEYYAALAQRDRLMAAMADPEDAEAALAELCDWSIAAPGMDAVVFLLELVSPVRGLADRVLRAILKANAAREDRRVGRELGDLIYRVFDDTAIGVSEGVRGELEAELDALLRWAPDGWWTQPAWCRSLACLRGMKLEGLSLVQPAAEMDALSGLSLTFLMLGPDPNLVDALPEMRAAILSIDGNRVDWRALGRKVQPVIVFISGAPDLTGIETLRSLRQLQVDREVDLTPLRRHPSPNGFVLADGDFDLEVPVGLTWTVARWSDIVYRADPGPKSPLSS